MADLVLGVPWMVTLDNHYVQGGQGEMLLAALAELPLARAPHVRRLGIRSIPACGANDEVLRFHGLDADSLCDELLATARLPRGLSRP